MFKHDELSQIKPGWITKALNKAATPFGLSVVNTNRVKAMGVRPFMQFFGNNVVYGRWNEKDYISDGFLKNAGLYSIVNRITSTAAQAAETFQVYKIKNASKAAKYKAWTGKGATRESAMNALMLKNDAYEIDDKHPFNILLEKPNEWQGINEFVQTSIGFKLLTGNRYLFLPTLDLGANAGRPSGIYNLPPQHMTIKTGDSLWTVGGYVLNLSKPVDIAKELVLHSRMWNPDFDGIGSHLYGLSPLRAATRTLDRAMSLEARSIAMLQNAGAAGIVYDKNTDGMTPEQASAIKNKVNNEVLGLENAASIAVANGDLGYINFGISAVDMALMEQEKYTDEKICNIYKVPPGLFQASANATDNNIAAWNRQLVTQACIPALADLRDDLNKICEMYGPGYYVDYDINIFPEMQEDQEKLANVLDKSWYLKPNEKRIARGFDEDLEVPMMNNYLVPSNLVEISTLDPINLDAQMSLIDQQNNQIDNNPTANTP